MHRNDSFLVKNTFWASVLFPSNAVQSDLQICCKDFLAISDPIQQDIITDINVNTNRCFYNSHSIAYLMTPKLRGRQNMQPVLCTYTEAHRNRLNLRMLKVRIALVMNLSKLDSKRTTTGVWPCAFLAFQLISWKIMKYSHSLVSVCCHSVGNLFGFANMNSECATVIRTKKPRSAKVRLITDTIRASSHLIDRSECIKLLNISRVLYNMCHAKIYKFDADLRRRAWFRIHDLKCNRGVRSSKKKKQALQFP